MDVKNEDLQIYGKIVSMSTEGVVADALQIYDDGMLTCANTGRQSDINQYFKNKYDLLANSVYDISARMDSLEDSEGIPLSTLSQILVI